MEFNEETARKWEKSHRRGKIAGGLLVVTAGVIFLARELGVEMPHWLFSWKIILIAIGIIGFVKHGFTRAGWLIPVAVGSAFLVADLYPEMSLKPFLWPVVLILVGLFMIFKPRSKRRQMHWQRCQEMKNRRDYIFDKRSETSDQDFIDSTSVMGGIQKNILSKKFKGGDITNVFGGTELNLLQADFDGSATLEITQVFGGTKLIVPANWQIQSNIVTVIGGVEDKRPVNSQTGNNPDKILILNGTTFCGGLEITTF